MFFAERPIIRHQQPRSLKQNVGSRRTKALMPRHQHYRSSGVVSILDEFFEESETLKVFAEELTNLLNVRPHIAPDALHMTVIWRFVSGHLFKLSDLLFLGSYVAQMSVFLRTSSSGCPKLQRLTK